MYDHHDHRSNLMFQLVMIIAKANHRNEINAFLDEDLYLSS